MVCDNSVSSGQYERMNHIWSLLTTVKVFTWSWTWCPACWGRQRASSWVWLVQ